MRGDWMISDTQAVALSSIWLFQALVVISKNLECFAGHDWVEDIRVTRMMRYAQVRRGRGPSCHSSGLPSSSVRQL